MLIDDCGVRIAISYGHACDVIDCKLGDEVSLTAEGRLQAAILTGLPIVMWFLIYLLNPTYAQKLFDHPMLIAVTAGFIVLGTIWIRKIVVFDF